MCSTWQLSVPTTGLMHSDQRQPGWKGERPIWPPARLTNSTVVLSAVRVSSGALKSRCSTPAMVIPPCAGLWCSGFAGEEGVAVHLVRPGLVLSGGTAERVGGRPRRGAGETDVCTHPS